MELKKFKLKKVIIFPNLKKKYICFSKFKKNVYILFETNFLNFYFSFKDKKALIFQKFSFAANTLNRSIVAEMAKNNL